MTVDGEEQIVHSERNAFLNGLVGTDDERQSICFHEAFRLPLLEDHQLGGPFLSTPHFAVLARFFLQYGNGGQKRNDALNRPLLTEGVCGKRRVEWTGDLVDGGEKHGVLTLSEAGDSSMCTEDTVVDDRSQRQMVEHRVDLIPQLLITRSFQTHIQGGILGESLLQLAEQATIRSALIASLPLNKATHNHIHELHLVVAAQEKHLVGIAGL